MSSTVTPATPPAAAAASYDGPEPDEHSPWPRELWPDHSHLVTEDDTPMDNIFSEKQQRLLTEALQQGWRGGPEARPFVTTANVGLYFALYNQPLLVPDFLVSLDVALPDDLWPKENRSYLTWMFGKPPDLVVEIVSNRQGREDGEKLRLYARGGVGQYVIYDPSAHLSERPVRCFRSVGQRFEEVEAVLLPETSLTLRPWTGRYENVRSTWLRWHDADTGALVPTGGERADAEQQRADRLAERLRALGVDPEQV